MANTAITGWGTALPEKILTNQDLEGWLDTSDEWIVERTGISERHIGGTTAGLATEAAEQAIGAAGIGPEDIDLIVLATTTADQMMPGTACAVQEQLGARCGAYDLNAACSGFVYALVAAHGHIQSGLDRILVLGSETLSRFVDWDDRNTAVLFGDGAGAVILERTDEPDCLLGWDLGSDGSARDLLYCNPGEHIVMEGREVYRRAVRLVVDSGNRALERAGLTVDDITVLVPHQANSRIVEAAASRLGISPERTIDVISGTGNTSAASIPLALAEAATSGRLQPGDLALLVGFGAGMTSGSAVIRWF